MMVRPMRCLPAASALFLALWHSGCATPGPAAFRHPDFRPGEIRRPAVLIEVSLDRTMEDPGSRQRGGNIAELLEIVFLEGLNAEGILPVDATLSVRPASLSDSLLDRVDRRRALERARGLKADVLLLLGLSMARRDVVYCRETPRPFRAHATVASIEVEVLRATDGARLLVEPASPALRLTDVEPDCERRRIERRLTTQELVDLAVRRALSLLLGREPLTRQVSTTTSGRR